MTKKNLLVIMFAAFFGGALLMQMLVPKPAAVVKQALEKLDDDTAFHAVATVVTAVPGSALEAVGSDPKLVIPLTFVGKASANFPVDKPPSGTATFMMGGTSSDGLTVDAVADQGGTSYAKLSNVPAGEGANAELMKALDGRWLSLPSRTLAGMFVRGETPSEEDQQIPGSRPAATWQGVRRQIASGDLFGMPKSLGVAGIRSPFVRRYKLPFVQDPLVVLAQDLKSLQLGRSLTAAEQIAVKDTVLASAVGLELWIDTRAKDVVQAKLDLASRETGGDASIVVKFTAWGEPVTVEAPADVTPFSDVVKKKTP